MLRTGRLIGNAPSGLNIDVDQNVPKSSQVNLAAYIGTLSK